MTMYDVIYLVQIGFLVMAVVMIVMARRGFNGFAFTLIALGAMLIMGRVELLTHALGNILVTMMTTAIATLFCWQVWLVWKDRHDHAEYLHWRENHAAELKLIREWQARKAEQAAREKELENLRIESGEQLSSWDHDWAIASQTRNMALKK